MSARVLPGMPIRRSTHLQTHPCRLSNCNTHRPASSACRCDVLPTHRSCAEMCGCMVHRDDRAGGLVFLSMIFTVMRVACRSPSECLTVQSTYLHRHEHLAVPTMYAQHIVARSTFQRSLVCTCLQRLHTPARVCPAVGTKGRDASSCVGGVCGHTCS